jgi:hypothetical protein
MRAYWSLVPSALLAFACAGCAFTQWTDRYFLGTTGGPPVHEGRVGTGIVLVPLAIAGDVATFPIQALVLVFAGDDALYSRARPRQAIAPPLPPKAFAALGALHEAMTARGAPPVLVGVDADANIRALDVSRERLDALVAAATRDPAR